MDIKTYINSKKPTFWNWHRFWILNCLSIGHIWKTNYRNLVIFLSVLAIRTLEELSSFNPQFSIFAFDFQQHLVSKKKVNANKNAAIPLHIPQISTYLSIMISNVKYCNSSNLKGDQCKQFDSIGFSNGTSWNNL